MSHTNTNKMVHSLDQSDLADVQAGLSLLSTNNIVLFVVVVFTVRLISFQYFFSLRKQIHKFNFSHDQLFFKKLGIRKGSQMKTMRQEPNHKHSRTCSQYAI